MVTLYDVGVPAINEHLKNILNLASWVKMQSYSEIRITASDGKNYDTNHYNLSAIIAVSKVHSERAVQFRKWATTIVEEFTIKGFAMDDERLKYDGTILGKTIFWRTAFVRFAYLSVSSIRKSLIFIPPLLTMIWRRWLLKRFFATVQNKLHWAIHGQTARGNDCWSCRLLETEYGLINWKDFPNGKIQKFDVVVAKNYLTEDELFNWAV